MLSLPRLSANSKRLVVNRMAKLDPSALLKRSASKDPADGASSSSSHHGSRRHLYRDEWDVAKRGAVLFAGIALLLLTYFLISR